MNLLAVVIVGASIASGFSGKPSGEWLAEWLNVPYRNEARIAQGLTEFVATVKAGPGDLVVNLDGSYWDSYKRNCAAPVKAVHAFYAQTKGARLVMATVPERDAGWFYRAVAGAESSTQNCRAPINVAIKEGCTGDCLLLDADELYTGRENEDIHLTPEDWKKVAEHIYKGFLAQTKIDSALMQRNV